MKPRASIIKVTLFLILSALWMPLYAQDNGFTLFIDWGDVLMTPSSKEGLKVLGTRHVANYLKSIPYEYVRAVARNPFTGASIYSYFKIKQRLYQFLNMVEPRRHNQAPSRDAYGALLPQIMCDHMTTPYEQETVLVKKIYEVAEHNSTFFRSASEKKLLLATATMVFSKKVTKTCLINTKALTHLRAWKHQGYKLVLFSNQAASTLEALKEEQPELIKMFDDIVISAQTGFMKPDKGFYDYALKIRDPLTCFLIDDRPENLEQAHRLGITPILCPKTWFGTPDLDNVAKKVRIETRKKGALMQTA